MRTTTRWVAATLALLAIALAGCGGGSGGIDLGASGSGGVYVALGDSFAAGNGASDPASTSYVALVAQALRAKLGDGLQLQSFAVGGATTEDAIDTQLDQAVNALRGGNVRLVTITIGGNDLSKVQDSPDAAACIADPAKLPCPVQRILSQTERRLEIIFSKLRDESPDTPIVVELYPNVFSGTGHEFEHPAEVSFGLLNEVIREAAGRNGVLIADPLAAFQGHGGELTHVMEPTPDNHPNDAGHRAIADAFLKTLGLPGGGVGCQRIGNG